MFPRNVLNKDFFVVESYINTLFTNAIKANELVNIVSKEEMDLFGLMS